MSNIRRWKSFQVKKYYNSDDLKTETPQKPKVKQKRVLQREKSVSMEHVPLYLQIENNELFNRQKQKRDEEERMRKNQEKMIKAKKRISMSSDDIRQFHDEDVNFRRYQDRKQYRSRYNTAEVYKDLMNNCEIDTKNEDLNKPGTFPVPEEVEPVLRSNRISVKTERPKTYSSTLTKKKDDILEFRGVIRLEIGNDICIKIRPQETLRLFNNDLQLLDNNSKIKETYRKNIKLKRGTKLISKREVEMLDDNTIYRLHFNTTKEAKLFQEIEKNYLIPTNSPYKNLGPWFGLFKLLKKRSSRDLLESRGIIKNEPIFGNTLKELCNYEHPVPDVILKITKLIEEPENIKSMGLYRASANLAVVQNIRFEINSGRWEILDKYKNDVDVLANTLKLFFRELKEPIITNEIYQQLKEIIMTPSSSKKEISEIIDNLPRENRETLLHIFKHLLKVYQHKEENKMDLYNISICWGPSLITLPDTCTDLVTQTTEFTTITEHLLIYYNKYFQTTKESVKVTDYVYDVIHKLINLIELNIETEGIYRKSGSNTKIEKILKLIEKENLSNLDTKIDVHDLCGVLKKYIATIRSDIIPDEFFYHYLEICDNDSYNIRDEVQRMVNELKRKDIIYLLFKHLSKVVCNKRKNKMSQYILSDMWMATLSANIQNYKKKMTKYTDLFLILMNLNDLPDLVADPRMRYRSKYDNVPEDIYPEDEMSQKISTKL